MGDCFTTAETGCEPPEFGLQTRAPSGAGGIRGRRCCISADTNDAKSYHNTNTQSIPRRGGI